MAASLPGATVLGGFVGYQVDRWLGSAPIGALGLGALAFAAALTPLLRPPPAPPRSGPSTPSP
ncbi:MAG: hypothetical protein EXR69_05000 [Myxococcales bacterium]|nr:hypothetical protein [Myxococcales bacterium]